jgi:ribosomal-protein-serine acetyltransferase
MKIIIDNNIHLKEISYFETIDFFHLIKKNHIFLSDFMPKILSNKSAFYSFKILRNFRRQNKKGLSLRLGIYYLNKLIGYIALKYINKFDQYGEVSYWIDFDHTGKGITTKSLQGLISYSFNVLNLNKLILLASTLNIPSNKIAKKLNFKFEGLFRNHELIKGLFHDINCYSILKSEFFK